MVCLVLEVWDSWLLFNKRKKYYVRPQMSDVLTLNLSWMIVCAGEYLKCILLLLRSIFIGGCHFIIRVQKVYCNEDMVTALKQLWSYIRISSFAQEFLNFIFFNLCLIFARLCFWTRKNFLLFGSIKLIFIHSLMFVKRWQEHLFDLWSLLCNVTFVIGYERNMKNLRNAMNRAIRDTYWDYISYYILG